MLLDLPPVEVPKLWIPPRPAIIRSLKEDFGKDYASIIPGLNASMFARSTSTISNGNDIYTVLLLHMTGADASTTFTDSSASAHTITANGNAQIDTAQFKFDTSSALFDNNSDYLSTPHSSDFDFTADFTIDFWVRPVSFQSWDTIAGTVSVPGGPGFQLSMSGATGKFSLWDGSSEQFAWTGTALSTGSWQHVAYVRSGTTYYIFKDGAQVGTGSNSANFTTSNPLWIGNTPGWQSLSHWYDGWWLRWYDGWIDEFRISKGIARWTSAFTPNTIAYS